MRIAESFQTICGSRLEVVRLLIHVINLSTTSSFLVHFRGNLLEAVPAAFSAAGGGALAPATAVLVGPMPHTKLRSH